MYELQCGNHPRHNFAAHAERQSSLDPSEMQTAMLDGRRADTQRFEARTTSEAEGIGSFQTSSGVCPPATAPSSSWRVVAVVLVLVVLLGQGAALH
jgi:hypothetical protein